jgi:hypothetical protein
VRSIPPTAPPRLEWALVRRIFVVKFYTPPTVAEVGALTSELTVAYERLKPPLHYLGIIDAGAEVPPPTVRAALTAFGGLVNSKCLTAHLVIEGDGFKPALQRSLITAMHLLKGQKVQCHKSADAAAAILAPLVEMGVTELNLALRQALRI